METLITIVAFIFLVFLLLTLLIVPYIAMYGTNKNDPCAGDSDVEVKITYEQLSPRDYIIGVDPYEGEGGEGSFGAKMKIKSDPNIT